MTDSTNALATRADREVVSSEATRVTFFEDRAEVSRRASCEVPAGVSWVAITGVTVALDDPSLVASIQGDRARVTAARVVRRVREEPALPEREMAAVEEALRAARRRVAETERALSRAHADAVRARSLGQAWIGAVQKVPRGGDDPAMARWRGAWDALDHAGVAGLDAVSSCERAAEDARLELHRAEARHALASRTHQRHEAVVEVQVEARDAHPVEIALVYRTPCALWRPEHLGRLTAKPGGGHELSLRTWATAWQSTGEVWANVACRFSTARPAQQAAAPLVSDDVLHLRKKSDAERRTVAVEVREQAVAVAGLQRGARAVDEMPGVEDGGEPLWFEASRPATIPSDGSPVRVEIAEARMPCEVDRVAYPERSEAAYVRATATLSAANPLLAGPVAVARGAEVVGRAKLGFVGRGEPFELGFGVDDGLRVRRHAEERREVTTVMGTQKIQRTVRVFVSNLGGEARRLTVIERVLVSEVKDVEVTLAPLTGAKHDARDGYVRWEVEVPARGTQEVSLAYRIEAAARVSLPF